MKNEEPKYQSPKPEEATSFREFHNEMRKYRRRVMVAKDAPPITGYVRSKSDLEKQFSGKKGRRALKRLKTQQRQSVGHFKGDDRPTGVAIDHARIVSKLLQEEKEK